MAQKIVSASSDQLQSQGATPARVPDAPRNIPPSLRGGQNLSPEMPLSQIQSQLPPARIGEFVDAVTPTAAKALNVASAVHAAYDISTKTVQTTQEKGPLMGAAQFGKTSAKHATALLWFAVGATVALAIASGGAATPLAAAAIGALITATGTTITHNVIDDLTPGLL